MKCQEFVDRYSEYRDDRLPPEAQGRFERHLQHCGSCARYDRVVRRGVEVFKSLPTPSPSSEFLPRLRHRLYHVRDGIPMSTDWPAGGTALAAVATVALLAVAWMPFASRTSGDRDLSGTRAASERADAPARAERGAASPVPEGRGYLRPADALRRTGRAVSLFDSGPFVTPVLDDGRRAPAAPTPPPWPARAGRTGPEEDAVRLLGGWNGAGPRRPGLSGVR